MSEPETYFQEAERLVNGARQSDYGHPLDNHSATAAVWSTWLTQRCGVSVGLTAEDVCWLNVLQKAVREANATKRDNAVDACGYLRNVEMIAAERSRRETKALGYDDPEPPAAPSSPSDLVGRVVKRFDGRDCERESDIPDFVVEEGDFGRTDGFGANGGRGYARGLDWTITHQRDGWAKCAEAYDLWFPVDAIAELA